MTKALSYQYVKSFIENERYQLLSKEYKNARDKIMVKCPEGHVYSVSYSNFKSGSRCPHCFAAKRSKSRNRWNKNDIYEYVSSQGYDLVGIDYHKNKKIIHIVCPHDHSYKTDLSNFVRGSRCKKCEDIKKRTENYNQVSDYYLTHTLKDTAEHFNIIYTKVIMIFQKTHGMSKRQFLKERS